MKDEVADEALPRAAALAPWLQTQLENLLAQRGHAWLLAGPSGLGQFDLAMATARAWLCDNATPHGACGHCASCHGVDVHTHADLCLLLPETLAIDLGWPLDEGAQREIDSKKRKPSKEIKVDAAREMVSFTQFTRSRGTTKVVVVFPAERMNHVTANTLLKTLEEPPGAVKFILATEAAHQLLPTIRSRCIGHTMVWPGFDDALGWLQGEVGQGTGEEGGAGGAKRKTAKPPALEDLTTLLIAAGGRPADALAWSRGVPVADAAASWLGLPAAMARGEVAALAGWAPAEAVATLQKLCHDALAIRLGAAPRFFSAKAMAAAGQARSMGALATWSKELAQSARTAEHPYNPGLMTEHLVSRARLALAAK